MERSQAKRELAVEEDGVFGFWGAGLRLVGVVSWTAPVNEVPRLKRLAIIVGSSSSSESDSEL